METFVQKQAFIVFIEELYTSVRERELKSAQSGVKESIQVFHQSLRYLVNHSEDPADSFVKFSEKSLKQLRSRQNQQIDKIYLQFKNPVPSKFQSVMNEYLK